MINISRKFKILFPSLFFLGLIFLIFPVFSAEIILSGENELRTGDLFEVKVLLSSEDQVNAIEGEMIYPKNILKLVDIQEGNSIINLWIIKPDENISTGRCIFSGITPGGWQGTRGMLFKIIFKVKEQGMAKIEIKNIQVLKNDGFGTKTDVSSLPLQLTVFRKTTTSSDFISSVEEDIDITPPEDFTPKLVKDELLFDGQAVMVFVAQDKGQGIDFYEVKEVPYRFLKYFIFWKKVNSPYVLKDQNQKNFIYLKAVDKSGNEKIVVVSPTHYFVWYEKNEIWGIIIIIGLIFAWGLKKIWRHFSIE